MRKDLEMVGIQGLTQVGHKTEVSGQILEFQGPFHTYAILIHNIFISLFHAIQISNLDLPSTAVSINIYPSSWVGPYFRGRGK